MAIGPGEHPGRREARGEHGASLAALLVVVVVLGAAAAAVVVALPGSTRLPTVPTSTTTSTPGAPVTTTTSGTTVSAAAVAQCVADFGTLETAVQAYQATNGALPPAGLGWATSSTSGGPYVQSLPVATAYAIVWDGRALDVVPRRGTASRGTSGTSAPPTGCDDL